MTKHEWNEAFNFIRETNIKDKMMLISELEDRLKPLSQENDHMIPLDKEYLSYIDTMGILNDIMDRLTEEQKDVYNG